MLQGFRRITLEPRERRTVEFTIPASRLALWNRGMRRVVEPGRYRILVGDLEAPFEIRAH
jgi:beta-glucosidase